MNLQKNIHTECDEKKIIISWNKISLTNQCMIDRYQIPRHLTMHRINPVLGTKTNYWIAYKLYSHDIATEYVEKLIAGLNVVTIPRNISHTPLYSFISSRASSSRSVTCINIKSLSLGQILSAKGTADKLLW